MALDFARIIDETLKDVPTDLLIGGAPQATAASFDVVDPGRGEVLTSVGDGTEQDMRAAVDAADAALAGWAAVAPRARSEILRRAYELMVAEEELFARLIVLENGKALADARGEVRYAAEFFRWYAEEAVRAVGELTTSPSGDNRILVLQRPIGVALLITPWNFPAAMLTRKIAPALAAGCTVVCKPAEETPLTALALGGLLARAGVPDGVVNIVTTSRPAEVVAAALGDPRIRKLSFTGSTEVGRILLRAAADHVISCSMELGGNAPFVVCDDADIDAAVAGAMVAKMRNGGEACTAANRFYVQRGAAEAFTQRLTEAMGAVRIGHGLDESVQLGPLVNQMSLDKVSSLVRDATAKGATALVGGAAADRPGWFFEPTVLVDVDPRAELLSTEIFGPVAPLVVFDTDDEAVELANDTEYGLVSYVYTQDLARGLRLSERLDAGMVGLNRGLVSDPAAPFGGSKASGLGREGGHAGLLEYLEPKYVATSW